MVHQKTLPLVCRYTSEPAGHIAKMCRLLRARAWKQKIADTRLTGTLLQISERVSRFCASLVRSGDDEDRQPVKRVFAFLQTLLRWCAADQRVVPNRVSVNAYKLRYITDLMDSTMAFLREAWMTVNVDRLWLNLPEIFQFVGLSPDGTAANSEAETGVSRSTSRNRLCHLQLAVRVSLFSAGRWFQTCRARKQLRRALRLQKALATRDQRAPERVLSIVSEVERVSAVYPELIQGSFDLLITASEAFTQSIQDVSIPQSTVRIQAVRLQSLLLAALQVCVLI